MKNVSLALFVAFCVAVGALAQTVCPSSPALHAAQFNTNLAADAANSDYRAPYIGTALSQFAQAKNLDVLCLNELRDGGNAASPGNRAVALQGFLNNPNWYVYQPPAIAQPGCKNACSDQTVNDGPSGNGIPLNFYVQFCAYTPILGYPAVSDTSEANFQSDLAQSCPYLAGLLNSNNNPQCNYCLASTLPGEDILHKVERCALNYNPSDAAQCTYGHNGEAGATLISRYPFVANEYHQFTPPALGQVGRDNWGIAYGKIQTPAGPFNLFCSSQVTPESAMDPSAAQLLNAQQSQDALSFIQSRANGQPAIYLSSTGSGPAVLSSPTGAANAQWPQNFALLQGGLTDALLANLDANSHPSPAAACTYNCGTPTPSAAAYVDHIMTSGMATTPQGNPLSLCETNGGLFFTSPFSTDPHIPPIPYSNHYGVLTNVSLRPDPVYQLTLSDNGNPAHTFSQGSNGKTVTATLTASQADTFGTVTVAFTVPGGLTQTGLTGPNNNWICSGSSCSTSSVVSAGSPLSFTLTFNVGASATSPQSVGASVTGGLGQTVSATPDSLTINPIVNVSAKVTVTQNGFGRNRATGLWTATLTVQNKSATAINGPIQVVFNSLTPGVTMGNNTGLRNGTPYITVLATGSLAPGATLSVPIQFSNPSNGFINYTPETDSGVF